MSTPYTSYPQAYTDWATALHNAFPAISFQAFFTWITAEGMPGYANNNPLNIAYIPLWGTQYGAVDLGAGYAHTAQFPSAAVGIKATIDAITGANPAWAQSIQQIGAYAQNNPGNDAAVLSYVQSTGWASSGYNGGLAGLLSSIDFTGAPTTETKNGGGIGSVPIIGGVVNGTGDALGSIGNGIGGILGGAGNAITSPISGATGQVESWVNSLGHIVGKWIILLAIAIGVFLLVMELFNGGNGGQMKMPPVVPA